MYIYMNVYMLMDPAAADPVSPQFFMPPIYVMIGGAQILLILQILLIYWLCTRSIHSYVEAQELIGWYYRFAYGDELITYKL